MSRNSVRMKSYVDAVNAERHRADNWRATAIIGTFGALIIGIMRATAVLAQTFEKRMDTTNEWRGALEDQAKDKATVQQFNQLKEQLDEVRQEQAAERNTRGGAAGNWKQIGAIIFAVAAINGIIFVIQGAAG